MKQTNRAGTLCAVRSLGWGGLALSVGCSGGTPAKPVSEQAPSVAPAASHKPPPKVLIDPPQDPVRSCVDLATTCGPNANEDCCVSPMVWGGNFLQGYDGRRFLDKSHPATISSFRLDRYEVTVGRFRKFLAEYAVPAAGSGKNLHYAADPGWDPAWSAQLPSDAATLAPQLHCSSETWTDETGDNELLPLNCVNWYEAQAFCIWDGGRLPTRAEWNYAAAGGNQQRAYPWSNPSTDLTLDAEHAVYAVAGPAAVGSKPSGNARWGHADMAGNVAEWMLDVPTPLLPTSCDDCVALGASDARDVLGSDFEETQLITLTSSSSYAADRADRFDMIGFRCARPAPDGVEAHPETIEPVAPTPIPAGTTQPIAQADYAQAMADVVCENMGACCELASAPAFDMAACKAREVQYRSFLLTQYADSVTFDPLAAGRCRDRTLKWTRACTVPTDEDKAVCASALLGKIPTQETCEADIQCAPGFDGLHSKCLTLNFGTMCRPDVPKPTGLAGEVCLNQYLACDDAAGLFCSENGTCDPKHGEHGSCKVQADCAGTDLYCDDTAHTCEVRPTSGMCPNSAGCALTSYCDAAFMCQPKVADGSVCSQNELCLSGYCRAGVCGARVYAPGDFCTSASPLGF